MSLSFRVICVALLAAGGAGLQRGAPAQDFVVQPGRTIEANRMSPEQARAFVVAAEERRLLVPNEIQTPALDTLRRLQSEDVRVLVELARSEQLETVDRASRALGRYERRELTPELVQLLSIRFRNEPINAVAQSFKGAVLPADFTDQLIENMIRPTRFVLDIESEALPAVARTLARLPYTKVDQLATVDRYLTTAIERVERDPARRGVLAELARAAESRARRFTRLQPVDPELATWLRRLVVNVRRTYNESTRVNAFEAVLSARVLDYESLRAAASDEGAPEARRLAALALGDPAPPLAPAERTSTLKTLMADSQPIVRIEAIRSWAKQQTQVQGCDLLIDAMADRHVNVAVSAIDILADQCRGDVSVTDRLAAEARDLPQVEWHKSSHALVALARRAPDKVTVPLAAHLVHAVWQVRMYAGRAAALVSNDVALERLAADREDNVREAVLGPLRRLRHAESDVQFVSALGRSDYQLLRTAANELKGATTTPELVVALVEALRRTTAAKKETSRDARMALLERLGELGGEDESGALVALLQDFDIQVAAKAAAIIEKWTGKPQLVEPQLLTRPALPTTGELEEAGSIPARVQLKSGRRFAITLRPDQAPLMCTRFLRLAKAGYYSGLTFHRIALNFVIQGGSPHANEYSGDGPYVHDELGLLANVRGSVGLSTRGRDTGDAQFYVNLVDNPRLDFDYTVFGMVDPADMAVIDAIVEGDVIESITFPKKEEKQ